MALQRDVDALTFAIAGGQTAPTGNAQALDNPSEIGLIVPALSPNAAVKLQVSDDGTTWFDLVDRTGAAYFTIPAGAGSYAVDSNSLGGALAYAYVRPVLSVATTNPITIKLIRKTTRAQRA